MSEQLGSGLAAWRMPVAALDGNSAWLAIARLAWNLGTWIVRWEFPTRSCAGSGSGFARRSSTRRAGHLLLSAEAHPPDQRGTPLVRVAGRRASEAADVALGGTLQLEFAESRAQCAKPNKDSQISPSAPWRNFRVTVDQIEALTGHDYLSDVDPAVEAVIEARVDNL